MNQISEPKLTQPAMHFHPTQAQPISPVRAEPNTPNPFRTHFSPTHVHVFYSGIDAPPNRRKGRSSYRPTFFFVGRSIVVSLLLSYFLYEEKCTATMHLALEI